MLDLPSRAQAAWEGWLATHSASAEWESSFKSGCTATTSWLRRRRFPAPGATLMVFFVPP
eukprot:10667595-Alexandrium_andersonii.AAC.1